jgi:hypothetical protein
MGEAFMIAAELKRLELPSMQDTAAATPFFRETT